MTISQTHAIGERIRGLEERLRELNRIGAALSTEKSLSTLLEKILGKSREIAVADSGSLYLIERGAEDGAPLLRFKLTQNDSAEIELSEFTLPISRTSIVGYVALCGESFMIDDVYRLSPEEGFEHNRDFDLRLGYRTRSMLVAPMKNPADEIVGVLQLINKKTRPELKLTDERSVEKGVVPFTLEDQELVESLASQACIAIENARLYEDIQKLLEGFIKASVSAIEARDPTTAGHSERVAILTCELARVVDRSETGRYRECRFDRKDLQELHYASLLHDFGKIGVPEQVLIKAKKLYPHQIEIVRNRFQLIKRTLQLESSQQKLELLLERSRAQVGGELAALDSDLEARLAQVDEYLEFVLRSNQPTVLAEGEFALLKRIAEQTFEGFDGERSPYLTGEEVGFLSIPRGTLNNDERSAIESHVTHTHNFLRQIPWTQDFRGIPLIAWTHHEKLDGSGYPRGLRGEEIPVQARIMTITDIFDALTARDRPYKKAVPTPRALDILQMEVDAGKLDPDLFRLFLEGDVHRLVTED